MAALLAANHDDQQGSAAGLLERPPSLASMQPALLDAAAAERLVSCCPNLQRLNLDLDMQLPDSTAIANGPQPAVSAGDPPQGAVHLAAALSCLSSGLQQLTSLHLSLSQAVNIHLHKPSRTTLGLPGWQLVLQALRNPSVITLLDVGCERPQPPWQLWDTLQWVAHRVPQLVLQQIQTADPGPWDEDPHMGRLMFTARQSEL